MHFEYVLCLRYEEFKTGTLTMFYVGGRFAQFLITFYIPEDEKEK